MSLFSAAGAEGADVDVLAAVAVAACCMCSAPSAEGADPAAAAAAAAFAEPACAACVAAFASACVTFSQDRSTSLIFLDRDPLRVAAGDCCTRLIEFASSRTRCPFRCSSVVAGAGGRGRSDEERGSRGYQVKSTPRITPQ